MHMFKTIGLLDTTTPIKLHHWAALPRQALANRLGVTIPDDPASLVAALSALIAEPQLVLLLDALNSLSITPKGLSGIPRGSAYLSPNRGLPPVPTRPMPPLDLFATLLAHKLSYEPNERDLVILSHEIIARPLLSHTSLYEVSADEEVHVSSLVVSGTSDISAMARCVGLPVAFAALGTLEGRFSVRGVQSPIYKEIYQPILAGLQSVNLGMKETVKSSRTGMTVEQAIARS